MVLLAGFGVACLCFLLISLRLFLANISGDWQAPSILVGMWSLMGFTFSALFYALFFRKPYFLFLYWFAVGLGGAVQIALKLGPSSSPRYFYSDLACLVLADGVPIALGVYLFVKRKVFP
jgi:hypothetical protein